MRTINDIRPPVTQLEQQHLFLHKMRLLRPPCPSCGSLVDQYESLGIQAGEYDLDERDDERYHNHICPHCKQAIKVCVPFFGPPWYWTIRETDQKDHHARVRHHP